MTKFYRKESVKIALELKIILDKLASLNDPNDKNNSIFCEANKFQENAYVQPMGHADPTLLVVLVRYKLTNLIRD